MSENSKCILCDTNCIIETNNNNAGYTYNCPNCGTFIVSPGMSNFPNSNKSFNELRYILSGQSFYNTLNKYSPMELTTNNWEKILDRSKINLKFNDKSLLLLKYFYMISGGTTSKIKNKIPHSVIYGKSKEEFYSHLNDLRNNNLIEFDVYGSDNGPKLYQPPNLTANGIRLIESQDSSNKNNDNNKSNEYFSPKSIKNKRTIKKETIYKSDSTKNDINKEMFIPAEIIIQENNSDPILELDNICNVYAQIINTTDISVNNGVFGVIGAWGRGKTYFIDHLIKKLKKPKDKFSDKLNNIFKRKKSKSHKENIIINFSAWKYQKSPELWAHLFETIAQHRFSGLFKLTKIFIYNCYKSKKLFLSKLALSLIWVLLLTLYKNQYFDFLITFFSEKVSNIINIIANTAPFIILFSNELKLSFSNKKDIAIALIKKQFILKDFSHVLGLQNEIQHELKILLKSWISNRNIKRKSIILVVDDIDRCKSENIIDFLDSLRVISDDIEISKRLKVIIAIDDRILKSILINKYNDTFKNPKMIDEKIFVREYFDKIFLFAVKLPPLTVEETEQMIISVYNTNNTQKRNNNLSNPESNDSEIESFIEAKNLLINESFESNIIELNDKQMSEDELEEFKNLRIIDCSPRRIRILYFKYIFLKKLLYVSNTKCFENNQFGSIIDALANYDIGTNSEHKLSEELEQFINIVNYD